MFILIKKCYQTMRRAGKDEKNTDIELPSHCEGNIFKWCTWTHHESKIKYEYCRSNRRIRYFHHFWRGLKKDRDIELPSHCEGNIFKWCTLTHHEPKIKYEYYRSNRRIRYCHHFWIGLKKDIELPTHCEGNLFK